MSRKGLVIGLFGIVTAAYGSSDSTTVTPYFEIAAPFVVNIQGDSSINFLQVNAQLRVTKPEVKGKLTLHLPAIQHVMIMILSEQNTKSLRSLEGKQRLRDDTVKEIQTLLTREIGEPAVEEVYFTAFVIQ